MNGTRIGLIKQILLILNKIKKISENPSNPSNLCANKIELHKYLKNNNLPKFISKILK